MVRPGERITDKSSDDATSGIHRARMSGCRRQAALASGEKAYADGLEVYTACLETLPQHRPVRETGNRTRKSADVCPTRFHDAWMTDPGLGRNRRTIRLFER